MDNNKLDLTASGSSGGAWALMATWLTPKILFCFLNITIATIFLSSNFKSRNKRHYQNDAAVEHHQNRSLARSPSLLQRVGSFDFSFFSHQQETAHQVQYAPPQPTQLQRSPSLLDRIKSFDFSVLPATTNQEESTTHKPDDPPQVKRVPSMLERVKSIKLSLYTSHVADPVSDEDHHVERSKSAGAGKVSREKLAPAKKMKKSASVKPRSLSEKRVEDVEERRPATTRPVESASLMVDEEVDAKADDFINRFRQQLKLQRLDSLLRFRETLNKGPTGSTK